MARDKFDNNARNANYNFLSKKEPKHPLGHGEFANLPMEGIIASYGTPESYRDGIVNSFSKTIRDISDISENQR